jgi:hypothetical protein
VVRYGLVTHTCGVVLIAASDTSYNSAAANQLLYATYAIVPARLLLRKPSGCLTKVHESVSE